MPKLKTCFVPSCENNTENSADKIFIYVPSNHDRRLKWFQAINNPVFYSRKRYYCCEDHFHLEKDAENWQSFKLFAKTLRIKPDVVPNRYIQTPPKEKLPSQLTDSEKQHKNTNIEAFMQSQRSAKQRFFPSTSRITDVICMSPSGKFFVSDIETVGPCTAFKEKSVQVVIKPKFRSVGVGISM